PDLLQIRDEGVQVRVTYKKEWDDGFGARGWKLDATIGDPVIIASTRETGQCIPTSVFVHDILDHFLSGFGVSGHRSEAMALRQLYRRTGSDPRPDYRQLVKEDLFYGMVNGEKLTTFLPEDLSSMLPSYKALTDQEIIAFLKNKLGEDKLTDSLVNRFFELGVASESHADESWRKLALDPGKRTEIGLALQAVLTKADTMAQESGVEMLEATIAISNDKCVLTVDEVCVPQSVFSQDVA
ncbi:hypothetical protein, partial [Thiohalophilus sp.]|uniref:hypothetical protein n=1 Tax=Thiohalophilus sp. TaxID=3028392 RepID=UPI003982FE9A